MSEVYSITGKQCGAILERAAEFCDILERNIPNAYRLDSFESHIGRGDPIAYLRLATHNRTLVAEDGSGQFTLEGEYPEGKLWVEYSPARVPRDYSHGSFGPMLRAVGQIAAASPFLLGRAVGTTCDDPVSLTVESLGTTSDEDQAAFADFLTAVGWTHYSQYPGREVIFSIIETADGKRLTYPVKFDLLG